MNQDQINQEMTLLPKEIRDLIGEFNVEHRKNLNPVLCDIFIKPHRKIHKKNLYWVLKDIREMQYCDTCDIFLTGRVWGFRGENYNFCSPYCMDNFDYQDFWYRQYH
jgi:hypothetical protein